MLTYFSTYLSAWVRSFISDEEGATAIEYAIIAAVLVVALVTVFWTLGDELSTFFEGIVTTADTSNPGAS